MDLVALRRMKMMPSCFYKRYLKVQRRVFDTSPRFNFELCVKRPFEALLDERHTFYYMEEKMEIDLTNKVHGLSKIAISSISSIIKITTCLTS